ncbi:sensor histidine kinase [Marinactinospora thermotolerans]|uniref:sensor histidine kinase n=1 Tax=Marinactinospora thermotolerans TaxID=531310 RepID=UPI003D8CBDF0
MSLPRLPFLLAQGVVVFTAGLRCARGPGLAVGCVAAAGALLGQALWSPGPLWGPERLVWLVWLGMALALGDATRSRRAYVAEMVERARRAEQTREEEARRRVAEERLRIARELHDVIAHHIALVNVQSGVAAHLLRSDPAAAEQALAHVRHSGREVLEELGVLLGVLRQSGEPDAPTEPAPGLSQFATLLETFASTGLRVDCEVRGEPRAVSLGVDLVAYRVLQESLTNVHKHGGGSPARLLLDYTGDTLTVEVRNDHAGAAGRGEEEARGTGLGLVGMRERVTAVGGTLHAGPLETGGFLVRAVLPAAETGART